MTQPPGPGPGPYGPYGPASGPPGQAYGPTGQAYGPTGQTYGPTGQAYGSTSPGQGTGPGHNPGPSPYGAPVRQDTPPVAPPAPRSGRRPLVVVGVIAACVVLLAVGAALMYRPVVELFTGPTATTSTTPVNVPDKGFYFDSYRLKGKNFQTTPPADWRLADNNGVDNDGALYHGKDQISYYADFPGAPAEECTKAVEGYQKSYGGSITDLPSVSWGPDKANAKLLTATAANGGTIWVSVYCVARPGNQTAALRSITADGDFVNVMAAAETMLAAWTWT